ncbi:di/tricarboxylate transporter [Tamaricihabitans halophyticus]|uniref:Di/tricarboxylate transporter n=1 Tax=Tamaricihabitans halophyticus TaxID=1262583 RepID=A0A4R2RCP6_9PSEU|nr:SLC13 family permease [Tamaricihabitans halophyticus]TCP57501.1 di/tricarboxylate transporter [Tamaricihabitans halophyticus]
MPDAAIVSIVVLFLLFGAAMWNRVHLGLLCFPAAYLVALYAGISADELTSFFPADFFILVLGVLSLFAIAQSNGTLSWILNGALRLVGGRLWLIPWLTFLVGGLLTGLGTLPAAATAIMAPIAIGFAIRYGFPILLMVLAGVTGILAGCFSPIAVYGLTALNLYAQANIELPSAANLYLLLASLSLGLLLTTTYTLFARRSARPSDRPADMPPTGSTGGSQPDQGGGATATLTVAGTAAPVRQRVATLFAMGLMVLGSAAFDLDLGFVAIVLAVVLQLTFRLEPQQIINRIPWGVIVLIAGILTYIGVMESTGSFELISDALLTGGSPLVGLLLLCYIAGITSFFASSIAVLATAVPLLPPLIAAGLDPVGALIAVALSCLLVDVNPLGITGGLFLAAAPEESRTKLFRQLLLFGCSSIVVAPALAWGVFGWW